MSVSDVLAITCNHLNIIAEVFVAQGVSRLGDVAPRHCGVLHSELIRNALHRRADDHQAADHGVLLSDLGRKSKPSV